jgi:sporulation protein YlmC with PRC-barrel domain
MIGSTVSTTNGEYGKVADLVFNGAGGVQFALVERNGQFHPVPFPMLQAGAEGQVTINVPASALDAITVDRNNLGSLTSPQFATQLQRTFGTDAARLIFNPTGNVPGTGNGNADPNSTAGRRGQLFSLANLFGDAINAQGGQAGTLSNVAIAPNGQIIVAIGNTFNGDTNFAFPFSMANVGENGESLTVDANTQSLTSVTVPNTSIPD